ncbi:MAG: UDP-glucose 4-epimerase GalE [Candidatus Pelagibacterales bacterium]
MILVTGGAGYIGSHFVVYLIKHGFEVLVIDNFSNSNHSNIKNIEKIVGSNINFIEGDVKDCSILNQIFRRYKISSVAHFAGFKSIPNSIINPISYYSENIISSISILESMEQAGIKKIIFSSSASVYGNSHPLPWHEGLNLEFPLNPYAQTKYITEKFLINICNIDKDFRVGILRYFNPIGYHESGLIGDSIKNNENNLIPAIIRVLLRLDENFNIFGNDYLTKDGTGIRDYIHIDDLISGHVAALKYINLNKGLNIWNLGKGTGYSVHEIISEFENRLVTKIPFVIKERRKGDLPEYWSEVSKAYSELNWSANRNLNEMIVSTINRINYLKETNF